MKIINSLRWHSPAIFLVAVVFVGLCGCVSRHVEIEQIGVMQLRRHWTQNHIRWEANIRVEKEEICPPSGVDCISAKSLFHSTDGKFLWVAIDEHISPEVAPAIYFFNTKTGAQISCSMCVEFVKSWATDFSSGWWLKDDVFIVFVSKRVGNGRGILVAHVGGAVKLTVVNEENYDWNRRTYGETISPDGLGFAWYECGPKCTLYWLNDDYSKILSEGTECETDRLKIYWENGRPMNGHLAATGPKIGCRNEKGELRFPLLPPTF